MERGRYRFRLGSADCVILNDYTNPNSLGQLVAGPLEEQARKAFRAEGLPADVALLDTNIVLIRMGERTMLIDTGWGAEGSLRRKMDAEGIAATEIDFVIITHIDGDHTRGLLDEEGGLSFPNAECAMTGVAWNMWTSQTYLSQLPHERAESVRRAAALIEDRTRFLDVDSEIMPGVKAVDVPGHRDGHIGLAVSSGDEEMLHVADGILHPIFIHQPAWHSPIDSYPAEAAETRRRLLFRIAESKMLMASAHLPFPGLGRVRPRGEGWRWQPVSQSP